MESVFMKYSISSNFEKCRVPVYWLLAEVIVCGVSYLGLQGEIVQSYWMNLYNVLIYRGNSLLITLLRRGKAILWIAASISASSLYLNTS
jgi:hypothetical protein